VCQTPSTNWPWAMGCSFQEAVEAVARIERSEIRESVRRQERPAFTALKPGYAVET